MDSKQELELLRKRRRLSELEGKLGRELNWQPRRADGKSYGLETMPSPLSGMSGFDRVVASYGGVMPNAALGVKQRLTETGNKNTLSSVLSPEQQMTLSYAGRSDRLNSKLIPDEDLAAVNSQVAESRRLNAPLDSTTGGKIGKTAGNIAMILPMSYIPGANTYTGSALTGAALGALQPTIEGESSGMNALQGAGFGVAGKATADVLSAILRSGYQGTKALFAPFSESGREQIAGNTLRAFTSNPDDVASRIANTTEIVPGSLPTTADVAQDAGISQLQRTISTDPQVADDFAQRALDRNSARLKSLKSITKYGDDLEGAVSRRSDIGNKLYAKAKSEIVDADDTLHAIMKRPSFTQSLQRAERIAQEEGESIGQLVDKDGKVSVKALHYIKMGMDDLVNDAPTSGIGKTELSGVKNTRGQLADWISNKSPAYKTARVRYEKASRPINREEVTREITSRATRSQTTNPRGEMTVYPSSFGSAMKNEGESVVRKATGQVGKTLDDVMTPLQFKQLGNILKDASMEQAGTNFGRATGSNTAQNLAGMNLLRQVVPPNVGPIGIPQAWAERNLFPTGAKMMNLIYGGQEPLIKQTLAEILLDPNKAAQVLQSVPPQQRQLFTSELLRALPAATGTAVGVQ